MKHLSLFAVLLCGSFLACEPVFADTAYPALHDVSGVAANDVLNLRAEPDAAAAIVGKLAPNLTGVEVAAVSPDGKWGRINTGENGGWAAMAYLRAQNKAPWFALQADLQCSGTEPFWTLSISPAQKAATFITPDDDGAQMAITTLWPGTQWHPVGAVDLSADTRTALAVIRGEACSDGMSDAAFGLSADIFWKEKTGAAASSLRGCCTLEP